MTDVHARRSDPISSHLTVKSLAEDRKQRNVLIHAAASFPDTFNDTELTERMNFLGKPCRPYQRNVVSRLRGILERDDTIIRVGIRTFDGLPLVTFILNPELRQAISRLPFEQTRMEL